MSTTASQSRIAGTRTTGTVAPSSCRPEQRLTRARRAAACVATGVMFLAGFAGVASGSPAPAVNLAFTAAVVLAWAWLSATSAHLYRHSS